MKDKEDLIAQIEALRSEVAQANRTAQRSIRQGHARSALGIGALIASLAIVSAPKATAQFGTTIASLTAQVTALTKQVDTLGQKTRYLEVHGTDTVFRGTNVYVQSGSGHTDGPVNGLGNLIIGYNETSVGVDTPRTGSHNLVIGPLNNYNSYGGAVVGLQNQVNGPYSLAMGGYGNASQGWSSVVIGGNNSSALALDSCVFGGQQNVAQGITSDIVGGVENITSNLFATVLGSGNCTASGQGSTVTGGYSNVASGAYSSISGGAGNTETRIGGWNVGRVSN